MAESISLKALLEALDLTKTRIKAGADGLSREVRAVSVMDAPDSFRWLRGGEFILTTGFILGGDEWQIEHFIIRLIDAGCAGVGVKKGRFLNAIPAAVVELANQKNFPIVEIPYSFGWSDVISAYYALYYSASYTGKTNAEANSLIAGFIGSDSDFYREFLTKLNKSALIASDFLDFDKRGKAIDETYYGILLLSSAGDSAGKNAGGSAGNNAGNNAGKNAGNNAVNSAGRNASKNADKSDDIKDIAGIFADRKLTSSVKDVRFLAFHEVEQTKIILHAVTPESSEGAEEWQCLLAEELDYYVCEAGSVDVSMGGLHLRADGVVRSFEEAMEARRIGKIVFRDKRFFYYPLLSVYNSSLFADHSQINLGYIERLDRHKTQLAFDSIETLEEFIECGSYKKASEKLYIHDNTLRYRVQKISEILHLDLNDSTVCHALLMQIKLWRLRNKK